MKFGPEWNHGPRLVLRRVWELFVGPSPSLHVHHDAALWQFPTAALPALILLACGEISWWIALPLCFLPIPVPFVHWQRPVTDSAYHLEKLGIDVLFGPWTWCGHWIDG